MANLYLISLFTFLSFTCSDAAVPDGYVVKVESGTVYLDWGKNSEIQAGDHFGIYRRGTSLKHPITGEILGHTETSLASGALDRVEEKFSIGHLDKIHGEISSGDRTRWQKALPSASMPSAIAIPAASTGLVRERWRSAPLADEAVGIALGDVDGDGRKELIVAFRKKVQVFRWKDNQLESMGTFEDKPFRHYLSVDAIDIQRQGRETIFATTFWTGMNRPHVEVLQWEAGALKKIQDFEGYARGMDRRDGTRRLYWQNLSRSREMSYTAVSEIVWEKGKFRPGPVLKLLLNADQLFGFTWGDFDGDGKEDLALLEQGERLRIFFQGVKWRSKDIFGGTKATFWIDDNHVGTLYPRLFTSHASPALEPKDLLLAPHNIPQLGIRLTHLKLYKESEIQALAWNGLEMATVWKLPLSGYLADFGTGDILHDSTPQLWVAAIGPGDKTILICYSLP